MSVRKILGTIILVLAFALPQSGVYADTQLVVKNIAKHAPLFNRFVPNDFDGPSFNQHPDVRDVCSAERQAILEFQDSAENAVLDNFFLQVINCHKKLQAEFLGVFSVYDENRDKNIEILKAGREFYCNQNERGFLLSFSGHNTINNVIGNMYYQLCFMAKDLVYSSDQCEKHLDNHVNNLVNTQTFFGSVESVEIAGEARGAYRGSEDDVKRYLRNKSRVYYNNHTLIHCKKAKKLSERNIFKKLVELFEYTQENRVRYNDAVQEYLRANCDSGKSCRDPELAKNLAADNDKFYGQIGRKDLELFTMQSQLSRGNDKILPAARAAIAELEATRKADIDRICAEYTFENPEVFCDKFGKE